MIKIFVVILNWNRSLDTIECVRSVEKMRTYSFGFQTIIVDNASTDDSIERFNKQKEKYSDLIILQNESNLGFAAGNNVGIEYALKNGANYILVLNNDTLVDRDLLVNLYKTAKLNKKAGAISPKIYFAPGFEFHKDRYAKRLYGKVIWYAGGILDWKNIYGSNRAVDEIDRGQFDTLELTDFATGACMLVRAKAFRKVGLFDEKYFMYLEDLDLCQRMKLSGLDILYSPRGIVWHKVAQSSAIGGSLNDYFIARNRLMFGFKYATFRTKIALVKESIRFLINGRKWQKRAVSDFYLHRLGKGSWK